MSKRFPLLVLTLDALVFLTTGLVFLFTPMRLLSHLGINSLPPEALTDIRAVYGGIELGIAAYLFSRILRLKNLHEPLLLCTLIMSAMVVTRIYGILVDGSAVRITIVLLTMEVIGTILSGAAWWQAVKNKKAATSKK
ncbi:MAG: DUF4345 domain-containing protein [Candidatus Hydrogenedentota bacterium]